MMRVALLAGAWLVVGEERRHTWFEAAICLALCAVSTASGRGKIGFAAIMLCAVRADEATSLSESDETDCEKMVRPADASKRFLVNQQ